MLPVATDTLCLQKIIECELQEHRLQNLNDIENGCKGMGRHCFVNDAVEVGDGEGGRSLLNNFKSSAVTHCGFRPSPLKNSIRGLGTSPEPTPNLSQTVINQKFHIFTTLVRTM